MKIKIIFSLMIILFVIIILNGVVSKAKLEEYNLIEKSVLGYDSLVSRVMVSKAEKYVGQNCKVYEPYKRTIIIRIDDIRTGTYEPSKKMVETFLENGYGVSIGVIPTDINDKELIYWLREINKNQNVEIALHGYDHKENEFMTLSENEAYERIEKGKEIIMAEIGIEPISFIPPYNEYSKDTIYALDENGFLIMSAKQNEYLIEDDFASLGYTAKTYDFGDMEPISAKKAVSDCKESLDETGLCVIMMHPNDYAISGKYKEGEDFSVEFYKLIVGLNNLNAEHKTFKDLISCENKLVLGLENSAQVQKTIKLN